jgi:hypothetical protein
MAPSTTLKLSIKPFTATLNILFVVALYSVRNIVSDSDEECGGATVEKDRQTRGESSLSTRRVWRAMDARRGVGSGRSIVLR